MCRAMARVARPYFWEQVARRVNEFEGTPEGKRASYLAAYANGKAAGERMRWHVAGEPPGHWGRGSSKRLALELYFRYKNDPDFDQKDAPWFKIWNVSSREFIHNLLLYEKEKQTKQSDGRLDFW
jgi:hypothetical protein